jgi:formylglycine-generating enzyme required for sulfatase activity
MNRFFAALLLVCASFFLAPPPATAVTIDTVPVGNAGNTGEVQFQGTFGAVGYNYRIGTTEVTVGQYTEFLNAVADTDTYALYTTSMATDLKIAGISRSGVSGSFSYSVIGSANHPVTYVSWGDAARFSNWLHNGQPTGLQIASTTEDGAYPLNGATTNAALNAVSRNTGATWFIPSEDEWYKGAYHKNDGATGNYWDYPTSTDSIPYSDQPPGSGAPTQSNTANFYKDDFIANGYDDGLAVTGSTTSSSTQNYLTDAAAYTSSTSPYGTFDQGGNVLEWNEALISPSSRGLRGGGWGNGSVVLLSSFRDGIFSSGAGVSVGFRVATVPEPSTAVLAILACGIMWWCPSRAARLSARAEASRSNERKRVAQALA